MSEQLPQRNNETPQFEQDSRAFHGFQFLGRTACGDAYVHLMPKTETGYSADQVAVAMRDSNEESDYSYTMVFPMSGSRYESFVTGKYNVLGEDERQSITLPTDEALKLAIKHGYISEEKLCEDIDPTTFMGEVEDPATRSRIAKLQGFESTEQWESEWKDAHYMLYEMMAGRKPTTTEIRERNEASQRLDAMIAAPIPETILWDEEE